MLNDNLLGTHSSKVTGFDETESIEQIPAIYQNLDNPDQNNIPETMEVHHHPDLHHKPKPWKEYFLEFLMIFLAVTLGFFAENIREYFSEAKKGKEYAISLKEDLIKDTVIIQSLTAIIQKDVTGCDTVINLIRYARVKTVSDLKKVYQANLSALGGFNVVFTDRTSSQLKNSGGLRFITKPGVNEGITDYWQSTEVVKAIGDASGLLRAQAREKSYLIFDNRYYSDSSDENGIRRVAPDAKLMTTDYVQSTEFCNRLTHFRNTLKGALVKNLLLQKKEAIKLIKTIDKEYGLKE